ncbi:MAG: UDP-N-acetylmuramoylalanyl-D-glutamate--2,6-diaminopimelate ligase [Opitutia bacterium]|nr:MAG: UDP-N-acetylmuramoylalanyl-D-glutamate--2,6-diaminopimelate ligase [Opitutae bacterium]
MPTFSTADLATWSEGRWTTAPRAAVMGFGTDTRALCPGDVFVAVRTERRDGHDFLGAARSQGAACALVERPVADDLPQLVVDDSLAALRRLAARWRANFPGRVIGITGSVGKTSTKELLAALLGAEAFVTEANLNNLIGVPLMLLRVDPARHRFAVIEAGMSVPGELGVSAAIIRPDIAIVTNVEPVHLEGVGSLAGIAREKATLVAELAPGGRAIIPAALLDWPEFEAQASRCVAVQFEGEAAPAVAPARLVRASFLTDARGQRSLVLDNEVFPLASISDGLARNAALALVAALEAGRPSVELAALTAKWMPPAGRGSVHVEGERTFYVDCYNSSPASLLDSARAFDRVSRGSATPRLFVLGGMAELGPASAQLHRECGAQLPLRAGDQVVGFGGDAAALLQGIAFPGAETAVVASIVEAAACVAAHRGYVFLKGSRAFALERCLPASLRAALSFH